MHRGSPLSQLSPDDGLSLTRPAQVEAAVRRCRYFRRSLLRRTGAFNYKLQQRLIAQRSSVTPLRIEGSARKLIKRRLSRSEIAPPNFTSGLVVTDRYAGYCVALREIGSNRRVGGKRQIDAGIGVSVRRVGAANRSRIVDDGDGAC